MPAVRSFLLTVTDGLDLDSLGDPLLSCGLHGFAAHLGLEESVHEGGFPQTTLPCTENERAASGSAGLPHKEHLTLQASYPELAY